MDITADSTSTAASPWRDETTSRWKNETTGEVTCLACVDGSTPDPITRWQGEPVPCDDCGRPAS